MFNRSKSTRKSVLSRVVPLSLALVITASVLFGFVMKPQAKGTVANALTSSKVVNANTLTMKDLVKVDTNFNDDHFVEGGDFSGITSPYGYYYFDRRMVPDGTDIVRKPGLLFYNYKTNKTLNVKFKMAKDADDDDTNATRITESCDGGAFYKDKLYLQQGHYGSHDDGFTIFRANPDGSDMKAIYKNEYRSHGESVYCDGKVYFSTAEKLQLVDGKEQKVKNETKIVSVDLNTLEEKTVMSTKGFDAYYALTGYYNGKIYYSYSENKKKLDENSNIDYEKNIKEQSYNTYDVKTGKTEMITPKIYNGALSVDGKYLFSDNGGSRNLTLTIKDLDTNEKTTLDLYKNVKYSHNEDDISNTYTTYNGKVVYYTAANKVTEDLNCYDIATKKLTKFKAPKVTDPKGTVFFELRAITPNGFIFNKNVLNTKTHQGSDNLVYITKEDYYAGNANYVDFDY